jgi:type I restriction enzyme R subunit
MAQSPTEKETVQGRILRYAEELGWTVIPREEAERRRGIHPNTLHGSYVPSPSLFFDEVFEEQVRRFNPRFSESIGSLLGDFRMLHRGIRGNREFISYLRNEKTFFDHEDQRDINLLLIDYDDAERDPEARRNIYEVTEEFSANGNPQPIREDVVFLINGIPVLVVECKNATKDEAIELGIEQIRRYHREAPDVMVPQQMFTATDSIGFSYGVTWNTARRGIFTWKHEQVGQLEAKVKTFFSIPQVLAFIKEHILFTERDGEIAKYVLRQHQTEAVERVVARGLDPTHLLGLVWHTQGSGKTFTMIKSADRLFRGTDGVKPTIIMMIDRNELEDQMMKNLAALGMDNVRHADRIDTLNTLLRDDYRGIIVTTIQKFRGMPADINTRDSIYVLIDEAHRTTGGELGTYLMAGLPNATFIGFTGTPIAKTAYGKGTFKTFGVEDAKGYLHKYSIAESIEDGTTLPLYYNVAKNEMLVPKETLDEEFLSLAETEGVAEIDELNKILDNAVNLKNFLKSKKRISKVAAFVAQHYQDNVEPLCYKAFLVAVDREACALYKQALDEYLPPEYSRVVYTGSNNDSELLKRYHIDTQEERAIRRGFSRVGEEPHILIVTEKLLTGFDAPVLYAMYLDKPMRDHTLLQAIARVNRPYENEEHGMVKPHGFVLDFVGIFDKLEKALAFDSDEVNAIVKDIKLLKQLFEEKMRSKGEEYLDVVAGGMRTDGEGFTDRTVDYLIEHFRDPATRKEFFKEYKEIEMLFEIIAPDAFLRPFLEQYKLLSSMYSIVRKAYAKKVYVDRDFQRKTADLVKEHVDTYRIAEPKDLIPLNAEALELIKKNNAQTGTRVINLVKSIEKAAEDQSDDPYLLAMAERAEAIREAYEKRQNTTAEALEELIAELEKNEERKKEQAEKQFDGLTYFVYRSLLDEGIDEAEEASRRIRSAFTEHAGWSRSDAEYRELRKAVTFAVMAHTEELERVTAIVDHLFDLVRRAERI